MKSKDFFPVKLEILSPVHIGSGQDIDPFSYIIREDESGVPMLYFIDLPAWIESRRDSAGIAGYFSTHAFSDIRKWLYEQIDDPAAYALAVIPVTDKDIVKTYKDVVLSKRPENRLLLAPALKNPQTYGLIIPGSSVKGAIHTAILDYLDREYHLGLKDSRLKYNRLDWEIFGKPQENTFKALKISDFEAPPGDAYIVSAKEKSRKDDKSPTPKDNCEVTCSLLMDAAPYALWGQLALGAWQDGGEGLAVRARFNGKRINETFSFAKICRIVTEFYKKRFSDEWKNFYILPQFSEARGQNLLLKKQAEAATGDDSMFLRVGHYSHIECVTITENNPFRRKGKRGLYPYGTTRTLANGLFPFGWIRISRATQEEYFEGRKALEAKRQMVIELRTRTQQALKEKQQAAEAERRKREAKRREAEAEELRKKEALKSLPEYKKQILSIENPKTDDNTVMSYYRGIGDFEGEEQKAVAAALKERWSREGRWKVNKKKKQYEKVQKIKEILGES